MTRALFWFFLFFFFSLFVCLLSSCYFLGNSLTIFRDSFSFLSCLSCKFVLDLKRHGYEKGDTFYALLVFIGE